MELLPEDAFTFLDLRCCGYLFVVFNITTFCNFIQIADIVSTIAFYLTTIANMSEEPSQCCLPINVSKYFIGKSSLPVSKSKQILAKEVKVKDFNLAMALLRQPYCSKPFVLVINLNSVPIDLTFIFQGHQTSGSLTSSLFPSKISQGSGPF